jgi:hypothetical protein
LAFWQVLFQSLPKSKLCVKVGRVGGGVFFLLLSIVHACTDGSCFAHRVEVPAQAISMQMVERRMELTSITFDK